MGQTDPSKQRRDPQPGAHTRNGVSRVSPAWRLRTRSCSHDNEMYRMGLDRNTDGEWEVVRNRVPAGLVNAMRAMRVKSERRSERRSENRILAMSGRASEVRIKAEPIGDEVGIYGADGSNIEMEDSPVDLTQMVDLTDSAAEWDEIRIYLDVEREVEGGHVLVDRSGAKIETIMRSVEVKRDWISDWISDVKMPNGLEGDEDRHREDFNRYSLAYRLEAAAKNRQTITMDLRAGEQEQPAHAAPIHPKKRCRFSHIPPIFCQQTFTTSGHASRHAKIHIEEKGIGCVYPGCGKTFTRADNMKQHLETHLRVRGRGKGGKKGKRGGRGEDERETSAGASVGEDDTDRAEM